jgi:hypothetical protein
LQRLTNTKALPQKREIRLRMLPDPLGKFDPRHRHKREQDSATPPYLDALNDFF